MTSPGTIPLGKYRGFGMELFFDPFSKEYKITLQNKLSYTASFGSDLFGNIQRLDNLLNSMEERRSMCAEQLENAKVQFANAKEEVKKPFPQEEELQRKSMRLAELNSLLDMDKKENEIVDSEVAEDVESRPPPIRKAAGMER